MIREILGDGLTGGRAKNGDSPEFVILTQGQLRRRKFLKHKVAVVASVVLVILYVASVFAEFFAPYGPTHGFSDYSHAPPQRIHFIDAEGKFHIVPFVYQRVGSRDPETLRFVYREDTTQIRPLRLFVRGDEYAMWGIIRGDLHLFGVKDDTVFLLGTDQRGRDLLSRLIFGGRISLSVGIVGVLIIVVLGSIIGTISGYYGGPVDMVIQRVIEVLRTLPQLALWMALSAAIPPKWPSLYIYFGIIVIGGLINWTGLAREVRGKVLAIRQSEYIFAAEVTGASVTRILFVHIIPSVSSHIIVTATLMIPVMILGESALSFLGLGIKPPLVSWGLLLNQVGEIQLLKHFPWLMFPALFIVVSILCFNFMGDALRDAIDPFA